MVIAHLGRAGAYDRARHLRGALLGHGLKATIVINQLTNGARKSV